ncbi:hypothetical protein BsWGS_27428 [Bradybaena similaris]
MSENIDTETVYVTGHEDNRVMSEKVQTLAGSIYKEFEKVIKKYDEDVVKDLMPLVVGILEALDAAFGEKQELEVEIELLREDNEQLLTQYEREKQLRKAAEQKYLEMEDSMEGVRKELEDKVETLESILRMSEIKSKNSTDLVSRLEEREQEAKNEYNKLHDRYTELFRSHMDYMERTKVLFGTDKLSELTVTTSPRVTKSGFNLRPVSVMYGNTIEHHQHQGTVLGVDGNTHPAGNGISLLSELSRDREEFTDSVNVTERATNTTSTPELEESHDSLRSLRHLDEHHSSTHNDSSVFEEIQATDIAEVDFAAGISDSDKEDEEEDEESKENDRDSVGDNFFGMCKELENLILENSELLATKNALNIVKDDLIAKIDVLTSEQDVLREEIVIHNSVRKKLQDRIMHLEDELKKLKEELEVKAKEPTEKEEEEGDVPMAQRKRFTRVEMARVLMERNQYKERLMELQEAVRWTEMVRASKEHPGELETKKRSGVWNFFGSLFSSSSKPAKHQASTAAIKPSSSTLHFQSSEESSKKHRGSLSRSSTSEFLSDDLSSDKSKEEREKERREQYKQVRALVKKDDGRMQAYGWSLPAKFTTSAKDTDRFQVPVPVPVYCRPLFDSDTPDWKIWCAAGVNLAGFKGSEGDSGVKFSLSTADPALESQTEGDTLHKELKDQELRASDGELMSSLVWVCTANHDSSQVSVIDANNPADILETFSVSVSHILCIASVPGVLETDYPVTEETLAAGVVVLTADTAEAAGRSPADVSQATESAPTDDSLKMDANYYNGNSERPSGETVPAGEQGEEEDSHWTVVSNELPQPRVLRAEGSPATPGLAGISSAPAPGVSSPPSDLNAHGRSLLSEDSEMTSDSTHKMSSVLPTMWMGTHNGSIYVHSSVTDWRRCIHSVKLRDSVLAIVHVKGRVLASLSDGTIAVFHRAADGQWDLVNYHLIVLGHPKQSIRCMTVVDGRRVWCGYKNKIHIVCPLSMIIQKSFDAHPRKESLVRQMCWLGDGVWVSIRLDSTLRLYHAYTHQHLQDVDVEPYVSKMLGSGKLGFSFVRVTAMLISCNRLWIGTANGVIMSIPLSENNKQPMIATSTSMDGPAGSRPGGVVRVYSDTSMDSSASATFIPYCSMAQAQLSFHGHKDAVKFFVAVPGIPRQRVKAGSQPPPSPPPPRGEAVPAPPSNTRLILAGGEGYVDFRLGVGDDGDASASTAASVEDSTEDANKIMALTRSDSSHIIVWQVTQE